MKPHNFSNPNVALALNTRSNQCLLVAVMALSAAGCHKASDSSEANYQRVLVSPVSVESAAQTLHYTGTIQPRHQTAVAFRAAGMVVATYIEVGANVRKGQVLARLDAADYTLATTSSQQQVLAATALAKQANADEQRLRTLVADGTVSKSEYDQVKARSDAANAQLSQARQQVLLNQNTLGYLALTAPSDGVVTAANFEVGQVVAQGMPVAQLSSSNSLEVAVNIPESVQQNLSARTARVNIGGSAYALTLRSVSPNVLPMTQSFEARYPLSQLPAAVVGNLKQGVTVDVEISGTPSKALSTNYSIPASAIVQTQQQPFVWQVKQQRHKPTATLVRQPIKVVEYVQDMAVVQGLTPEQWIVSVGAFKLSSAAVVYPYQRATLQPLYTVTPSLKTEKAE